MLFLLLGCPGGLGTAPEVLSTCDGDDGHAIDITDADTGGAALAIVGDTISIPVGYGGGCEEHLFSLCWPDATFAESDPVQVTLELWHGGTADMCEAYIMETLTFDLTPLKEAWHSSYGDDPGIMTVHVAEYSVEYSFE